MTIIDSQVHAYEANTPKRPWHSVPNCFETLFIFAKLCSQFLYLHIESMLNAVGNPSDEPIFYKRVSLLV